jgi:hypothetical protein
MVLPKTAELNAGLCGQCARSPVQARQTEERKKKLAALGAPSVSSIRKELVRLTELAAKEARERFSEEGIYAFLLHSDPDFESVLPRVMTDKWADRMPSGARWGGSGWYDQNFMLMEAEFSVVAEWISGLLVPARTTRGDLLLPVYLDALQNLRRKRVFPELTSLLLVSDGMGYEEMYAIAEIVSGDSALAGLRQAAVMDHGALASMRQRYSVFHNRAEPSASPKAAPPHR